MVLSVSIELPLYSDTNCRYLLISADFMNMFSKRELFYLLTAPIVLFLTYKLSLELWCLTYGLFYGS
jgi:hypothetical protein